jgi:hypothetical protein
MRFVIETVEQYGIAQTELRQLEDRLQRLQAEHPAPAKGLTKAGVRKLISLLHEELAVYEGGREIEGPGTGG